MEQTTPIIDFLRKKYFALEREVIARIKEVEATQEDGQSSFQLLTAIKASPDIILISSLKAWTHTEILTKPKGVDQHQVG